MVFRTPAYAAPPSSLADPNSCTLQQKYPKELSSLGTQIKTLSFPRHFYLSLPLDVDERREKYVDQRSLRFAMFNGRTVLEVTGNYFVAYPREQIERHNRVRQSLEDVLLPILKVAVSEFQTNPDIYGYALEVSHRVRGKVLGVPWETAENVDA